jgi:hypothetical protein
MKGSGESKEEFHQSCTKTYTLTDKVYSGYLVRNINILTQYTFFQYWLGAMSLYSVNVAKTEERMFRVQEGRDAKSIHVFVLQRLEHNLMKHGI